MRQMHHLTRAVLLCLLATPGQWVDGSEFAKFGVGSLEGTRRFRELREYGYPVECRRPRRHLILGRRKGRWDYRIRSEFGQLRLFEDD